MLAVHQLRLHHFRNYALLALNCSGQSVVLTGANGSGKTNILEALSLLSPGRGLRKAKLGQLQQQQQLNPWVISADCTGKHGDVLIGTGLDASAQTEKRTIRIDEEPARGQSALMEQVVLLWQTPQMDGLFLDSGSERRRFIDRLVHQFDAEHASRVAAYEYAMRERTKLLQRGVQDPLWLKTHETTMAEKGVAITLARLELVERLNHAIQEDRSHFPKALLELKGAMETLIQEGMASIDAEERWLEKLASMRVADARAGRALWGAHRSELMVVHETKQMEAQFCSTGEQKALLLALLLAHSRAQKSWHGHAPILLLDEVVAHLDQARREALADAIERLETQAWLTGTDAADFSCFSKDYQRFHVEAGQVGPVSSPQLVKSS